MGNMVRFACTALSGSNKVGRLTADENGYYTTVVGALDVFNSVGQYYAYEGARELFEQSSQFMRRVKKGNLMGEQGHPKFQPGMTDSQFAQRILSIYEENVCCHHKEIFLDFDNVKDEEGRPVIAIMSKVKPSGPHGAALRESFENPDENVNFSIRAFTDDFPDRSRGYTRRILRTIVTWDRVTEPGISVAQKFKSPSLEMERLVEHHFSRATMRRSLEEAQLSGVAQECAILTGKELFQTLGWDLVPGAKPAFLDW